MTNPPTTVQSDNDSNRDDREDDDEGEEAHEEDESSMSSSIPSLIEEEDSISFGPPDSPIIVYSNNNSDLWHYERSFGVFCADANLNQQCCSSFSCPNCWSRSRVVLINDEIQCNEDNNSSIPYVETQ
jgi:hypothetical protein